MKRLTYGIVGTGAIGGYYGARLAHAGHEVHFLFHRDYEHVLQHGLEVKSCKGDFLLPHVNAYSDTRLMPPCDVVIVALKTVQNTLLPTLLPPLLRENTLVLLIQNGIGVEADVQKRFPQLQLAAGLAFICSAKTKPGVVDHMDFGSINLANYSCTDEQQFQQLLTDFNEAGVEAHGMEYYEARWKKAVWNMPFNGMTVVHQTDTLSLLRNPLTRKTIHAQMLEVIHAAQACGVERISEAFADKMIETTLKMKPYSPSMKLDFDFHRPMEIEYLYTRPIQEAAAAGCHTPCLRKLEQELLLIQASSDRSKGEG